MPDAVEIPHREFVEFVTAPGKYKLILWPRDTFKSTWVSVAYVLWRLAYNPNLRILIDSRTVKRSINFLRECKEHMERNESFRKLYGSWKTIPGWREEFFIHPQRTTPLGVKSPSIMCGGIDSPVTGGHYDVIICDDLMDETNSQTEAGCQKAIMHYRTLFPILEPDGELFVVGTVWSHNDVYNHILSEPSGEHPWKVLKTPAILPDGSLLFPSRLTHSYLEDRRAKLGPYMFSAQFMLEAIAPEDRRFESDHIQYLPINVVAAEGRIFLNIQHGNLVPVNVSITVDPAISQKKYADYTGITAVGCDPIDIWYVLSARRVRGGAQKIIDEIVKEIRTWNAGRVGIEVIAYQQALKEFLEPRLEEEGLAVELIELKTGSGRGKQARIEGLQPRFFAGSIYFREGMGPELETEVLNWSPTREMRHDDLIDALSHQMSVALPASPKGQRTLGPELFDLPPDERKRLKERKARQENLSGGRPSAGYG